MSCILEMLLGAIICINQADMYELVKLRYDGQIKKRRQHSSILIYLSLLPSYIVLNYTSVRGNLTSKLAEGSYLDTLNLHERKKTK